MTDEADPPPPPTGPVAFERDVFIDKPGIVGARWWHKSLIAEDAAMRRRTALATIAKLGALAGGLALVGYGIVETTNDEPGESVKLETRKSIDMQRKYGWDFGARGEALVFDGKTTAPFSRADLAKLASVMQSATFPQLAIPTLLESLTAAPTSTLPTPPDGSPAADSAPFHRLVDVINPLLETDAMKRAYAVGASIARLAAGHPTTLALLVDLPGLLAVALAAGASEVFEPVLLLDNWPHPRGVVPSHKALAALAYYQPRFASANGARATKQATPPCFLLDRDRLANYSEDSSRFDNRYFAKPPPIEGLSARGFTGLLYVVEARSALPQPIDVEVLANAAPLVARAVTLDDFSTPNTSSETAYYGGTSSTDASLWVNYPFFDHYVLPAGSTVASNASKDYRFTPRTSSSVLPVVGATAVAVTASGLLVAAALDRRGSMNRFSGGWGG